MKLNKLIDHFQHEGVMATFSHFPGFILCLLVMSAFCAIPAWAEDPPILTGVECYNSSSPIQDWTHTLEINVALEGVSGDPLWVDIDEDPDFDSRQTVDYLNQKDSLIRTLSWDEKRISSVAFCPDGSKVLAGSWDDNNAKLWDAQTGSLIRTFSGHTFYICSVAFSPDGTKVLTGSCDNTAKLWNAQTGAEIRTFSGHTERVNSVAFSPDGSKLLTGGEDYTTKLWDAQTGSLIRTFSEPNCYPVWSVAFSPDGDKVLTRSGSGTAKLWNVQTGEVIRIFSEHTCEVTSVAFSPDGTKVLTGNMNGISKLWDAQTGVQIQAFLGHSYEVHSVAFSPDGSKVLTGCVYGTAKLWNVQTGEEIRTFLGHKSYISSVAFSPEGSKVMTGSGDGTIKLWDTRPLIAYTLDSGLDGPRIVYVRLRNNAGSSQVHNDTTNLDKTPPSHPGKPAWDSGQSVFNWNAASDPDPGSGVASYDCQVGTWPELSDVFDGNTGTVTSKSVDGSAYPLYCRVRAVDVVGNVGQWSQYNNTPPSTPILTITPETPRTYETIEATASSTDEEGHQISYEYQWLLNDQVQVEGMTLDASLTAKGQQWECRSWATDSLGGRSHVSSKVFPIMNTFPTQPVVEIVPDPYIEDKDLVVDVQIYSTDQDGDEVAYDFKWDKSTDGGASWIHKVELDGSSSVSASYIHNDELWRVECTPYEKQVAQQSVKAPSAPKLKESRIDGLAAYDQLFTGANNSPSLVFNSVHGWIKYTGDKITADWIATDADGDSITVDLYWTDKGTEGFVLIASGLESDQHNLIADVDLPEDRPVYLHATVTDSKGAITHVTSASIEITYEENSASDWLLYR